MGQKGDRNFFSVNVQDLLHLSCGKSGYGQKVIDLPAPSFERTGANKVLFPVDGIVESGSGTDHTR